MLTRKQHELLNYVNNCLSSDDVPPSFEEMREALGLKSKSGIHRLISGLEERGYIRRLANRARAIEIVKLPRSISIESSQPIPTASPAINATASNDMGRSNLTRSGATSKAEMREVPVFGRIGNNMAIEALDTPERIMMVPLSFLGEGEHLSLEILGEYMNGAGIQTGDTVIIERCNDVDNGTIALCVVDDNTVTLKRYRRHGPNVVLDPANKVYVSTTYTPDRVKVIGRLVSLLRKY